MVWFRRVRVGAAFVEEDLSEGLPVVSQSKCLWENEMDEREEGGVKREVQLVVQGEIKEEATRRLTLGQEPKSNSCYR